MGFFTHWDEDLQDMADADTKRLEWMETDRVKRVLLVFEYVRDENKSVRSAIDLLRLLEYQHLRDKR